MGNRTNKKQKDVNSILNLLITVASFSSNIRYFMCECMICIDGQNSNKI